LDGWQLSSLVANHCGLGSLTNTGVQQHILNGALLPVAEMHRSICRASMCGAVGANEYYSLRTFQAKTI